MCKAYIGMGLASWSGRLLDQAMMGVGLLLSYENGGDELLVVMVMIVVIAGFAFVNGEFLCLGGHKFAFLFQEGDDFLGIHVVGRAGVKTCVGAECLVDSLNERGFCVAVAIHHVEDFMCVYRHEGLSFMRG